MENSQTFAILSSKIEQLIVDIKEMKEMFKTFESRIREIETNEAGFHPLMNSRIDAAWRKLDEHEQKLDKISNLILRLEQSNRIIQWIGALLGSTIIVWLVTQILRGLP